MSINSLPQEPEKRRAIVVLSRTQLQQLERDPAGAKLRLNEQVCVLDASVKESSPLVEKLRGSGLLNAGSILIQNPYDPSDYADIVDASYSFAQAKCIHFANLCGLLAARKVSVEQVEMKTNDGKSNFSGNINSPYGGGGADVERSVWERMKTAIALDDEYDEGSPNIDEAEKYLRKNQCLSDPIMKGLLDLRKSGIPIKKRNFALSVSKDSQKNLNVAFSLNVPVYADLKGKIEQIKKESYEFTLKINVEFW